jgi:8-oxo-dGTP pyrophosphatase MutT (NUDIX family)
MILGIDVGGEKKGFHIALLHPFDRSIHALTHFFYIDDVLDYLAILESLHQTPIQAIGIDAPPVSYRPTRETRPAERALFRDGFRIQWTPYRDSQKQEWMVNGANLWDAIQKKFPHIALFETFPTASSQFIIHRTEQLPLDLLSGKYKRRFYTDYLDGIICAFAANDALQKRARVYGSDDPIGAIHVLDIQAKRLTLGHICQGDRILLGKKKRGFGMGLWNGFGGKLEPGETPEEALVREIHEEIGVHAKSIMPRGTLLFRFEDQPTLMDVSLFWVGSIIGSPEESEEMLPSWFPINTIPYDQMWKDDKVWLPYFLKGNSIQAEFIYKQESNEFIRYHLETQPG